jgi:hypothetical protein
MRWLTWRQHRLQLVALAAVAAALLAYLVQRALPLVEPARVMRACASGAVTDCDEAIAQIANYVGIDRGLVVALAAVNLLPALVGAFWGAPLIAREFERGTHRLVWAQSVTRRRWLAVKLATLGAAAVLGGVAQSLVLTWAIDQFVFKQTVNRFADRSLFDIVGVVPPVLWLFALVLGVAVGLLVRRTMTAMAITPILLGVVLLGLNVARPHYAPPQTRELPIVEEGRDSYLPDEDWFLGGAMRRADGRIVPADTGQRLCPTPGALVGDNAKTRCLARHGLTSVLVYHPQRQYWRFQWTEATILLAGALLLGTLVFVRVSRRAD